MFDDFDTEIVGFEPCPKTERVVNDRSSQTADLQTSSQGTQTATSHSSANQTDSEISLNSADSYDTDKLLKFLTKILPHVEKELKHCNSNDLNFSKNDIEFGSFSNDNEEESEQLGQKTILKPDFCKGKIVSCLSWNSSNVMLVVAYTEKDHEGWCCHETAVGLYNTGRPLFEKDPPEQLLKVSGCVRCIRFHDRIPSLLAGGLYSGEVIVWDLKNDNNEVLMINKKGLEDETSHVDVITSLIWREDENGLWLVTAGRDGRIILWKVSITNQTYKLYKRFLILKQHILTAAKSNEHLEVLHMDFQHSSNYFVVACGGGNIFYCSLGTARQTSSPHYEDPFLRSYKPRIGIITCISCSNDLFASSGTDSEIHIFKYDQETPVLKIYTDYTIIGLQWGFLKELISWGSSTVESHDIMDSNKKKLLCAVEDSISTVAFRTQSIRYNRKIGVGNQRGEVLILKT